MAAQDAPSFDDLTPINPSNDTDDDEVPTVKLDPGEDIVAEIRHIERNVGRYGNNVLHLTLGDGTLCKMWSNRTIDDALEEAGVGAGDTIGIRKDSDPYTYTIEDDDGNEEEREAYVFQVAVLD